MQTQAERDSVADRRADTDDGTRTGQWRCDRCRHIYDDNEGYAEVDGGYWCETCCEATGTELTVRT